MHRINIYHRLPPLFPQNLIWSRIFFLSTQMYIKICNFLKNCNKYGILRYQIFSVERNMFWNYHKYILPSASLTCARSREKQGNVNADPTANASPPPPSNLINDDDQDDYDGSSWCGNFWKAGLRKCRTFKVKKKKITWIDSNSSIFKIVETNWSLLGFTHSVHHPLPFFCSKVCL